MVAPPTLPADARLREYMTSAPIYSGGGGSTNLVADSTIDVPENTQIVDLAIDYYGKRLAVCGDRVIFVYEISTAGENIVSKLATGTEEARLVARLEHPDVAGPLQQICWSDPTQGTMIAACGACGSVMLWREGRPGDWSLVWRERLDGAATTVQIGPKEFGLFIAAGSSSGLVTIFEAQNQTGPLMKIGVLKAHQNGVSSVSWAVPVSPATLASGPAVQGGYMMPALRPRRLVSGGFDSNVKIWRWNADDKKWVEEGTLSSSGDSPPVPPNPEGDQHPSGGGSTVPPPTSHAGPVRSVAWRPNIGIPSNFLASGSEDGTCKIWVQTMEGLNWQNSATIHVENNLPVNRVTWSVTGLCVCLSCGEEETVRIFKEDLDNQWRRVDRAE
ncbi:unnamed protein product [Amoebophrya sp. A120]|nr:unnamed protein product [Amoebophrya sp. A120]|eukprot:GSA120T00007945001.1